MGGAGRIVVAASLSGALAFAAMCSDTAQAQQQTCPPQDLAHALSGLDKAERFSRERGTFTVQKKGLDFAQDRLKKKCVMATLTFAEMTVGTAYASGADVASLAMAANQFGYACRLAERIPPDWDPTGEIQAGCKTQHLLALVGLGRKMESQRVAIELQTLAAAKGVDMSDVRSSLMRELQYAITEGNTKLSNAAQAALAALAKQ